MKKSFYRTQNQARQARQRMATAERNLHEAEARLRQAEEDLRTRSRFDANQLQREIKEQGRILTNELDSIEESIRLELGRQNVHLRKQLDEVRANVNASNRSVDELNRRINQLSEDFNAKNPTAKRTSSPSTVCTCKSLTRNSLPKLSRCVRMIMKL